MWTPEVDQPENLNCFQDNPNSGNIQSNLIKVDQI